MRSTIGEGNDKGEPLSEVVWRCDEFDNGRGIDEKACRFPAEDVDFVWTRSVFCQVVVTSVFGDVTQPIPEE